MERLREEVKKPDAKVRGKNDSENGIIVFIYIFCFAAVAPAQATYTIWARNDNL